MKNFKSMTGEPMTGAEKMKEIAEMDEFAIDESVAETKDSVLAKGCEREADEADAEIVRLEAEAAELIAEGYAADVVTSTLESRREFLTNSAAYKRRRAAEYWLRDRDKQSALLANRRARLNYKRGIHE